jgi:hypothetical protein
MKLKLMYVALLLSICATSQAQFGNLLKKKKDTADTTKKAELNNYRRCSAKRYNSNR